MDGGNWLNGFQFDHDPAFDKKIEPIATCELNGYQAPNVKFPTETLFAGRFQEPWTQKTMNFVNRCANDGTAQLGIVY